MRDKTNQDAAATSVVKKRQRAHSISSGVPTIKRITPPDPTMPSTDHLTPTARSCRPCKEEDRHHPASSTAIHTKHIAEYSAELTNSNLAQVQLAEAVRAY